MNLPDLDNWLRDRPGLDQAHGLRDDRLETRKIPNLISVVSGKGGVGKTNTVANVAIAAAGLGARVLVIDGDMGLSNMDVLLGLAPARNAIDVLDGRCSLEQALITGPNGIRLLAAGSGRRDLVRLEGSGIREFLALVQRAANSYELVFLDAGAGIGAQVVECSIVASLVLLVSTPEPTSLTDAYATCKTLWRKRPGLRIENLVNMCGKKIEGRSVHEHLEKMCERFLDRSLPLRGILDRDHHLGLAVLNQSAVVSEFPASNIARQFVALAHALVAENSSRSSRRQWTSLPGSLEGTQ